MQNPLLEQTLTSLAAHFGISMDTPWKDLPESVQDGILNGVDENIDFTYQDGRKSYTVSKPFEGVLASLARRLASTDSMWVREELSRYQSEKPCHVCHGARLRPEALSVRVANKTIAQACDLPIGKALEWFETVMPTLTPQKAEIARRILREIQERLTFLDDVGLDYLTLSRSSATLSGGKPADPAGQPDRLGPDWCAVCVG